MARDVPEVNVFGPEAAIPVGEMVHDGECAVEGKSAVLLLRLLIRQVERALLTASGKADAGTGDDQHQP